MSLRKVVVKEYLTTTQHGAICIFCKLQIRTNQMFAMVKG